MGWGWVGGDDGGPCDFSVSPSPFGLDFGTLDFGLWLDKRYVLCTMYLDIHRKFIV